VRVRLVALLAALSAVAVPVASQAGTPTGWPTEAQGSASARPTALRLWPLGDSITLGASWPTFSPGGYRTALDQILTHQGVAHRFLGTSVLNSSVSLDADGEEWHDGHGGYRIDQVLNDLTGVAHAATDDGGYWLTGTDFRRAILPDAVLIHLGTNDIMQHWDDRRFPTRNGMANFANARQRAQFVADMTGRLATLLARIHQLRPRARLVVATIIPIAVAGYTSVVPAYAAAVRKLVRGLRAERLPVTLADAYAAFTVSAAPGTPVAPGLLSYDEIHPTTAGYAVMARTFAGVIAPS